MRTKREKGSAILELALCVPMLTLMLLGAMDFSRAFYQSITLASGARAGAVYGVSSATGTPDLAGIEARVLADTIDLTGVTVTSAQTCSCNDTDTTGVSCTTTTCPNGSGVRSYLKVTAAKTFTPMLTYVGMPGPFPLGQSVTFRVQ
jgi:Flp pilus assembly protein TadG